MRTPHQSNWILPSQFRLRLIYCNVPLISAKGSIDFTIITLPDCFPVRYGDVEEVASHSMTYPFRLYRNNFTNLTINTPHLRLGLSTLQNTMRSAAPTFCWTGFRYQHFCWLPTTIPLCQFKCTMIVRIHPLSRDYLPKAEGI